MATVIGAGRAGAAGDEHTFLLRLPLPLPLPLPSPDDAHSLTSHAELVDAELFGVGSKSGAGNEVDNVGGAELDGGTLQRREREREKVRQQTEYFKMSTREIRRPWPKEQQNNTYYCSTTHTSSFGIHTAVATTSKYDKDHVCASHIERKLESAENLTMQTSRRPTIKGNCYRTCEVQNAQVHNHHRKPMTPPLIILSEIRKLLHQRYDNTASAAKLFARFGAR